MGTTGNGDAIGYGQSCQGERRSAVPVRLAQNDWRPPSTITDDTSKWWGRTEVRRRSLSVDLVFGATLFLGLLLLNERSVAQAPTWSPNGLPGAEVTGLVSVCDGNDCAVVAGTSNGVHRTIDAGASWSQVGTGIVNGRVYQLSQVGGVVILGTDQGAFRSSDGAATWQSIYSDTENPIVSACHIGPAGRYFVVAQSPDPTVAQGYLLTSVDGGVTWQRAIDGIVGTATIKFMITDGPDVFALASGGLISYENLYKWDGTTSTWIHRHAFNPETEVRDIVVEVNGRWIASTSLGLLASSDRGLSWTFGGIFQQQCDPLTLDPYGTTWVGTARHGISYKPEGSQNWIVANGGLPPNPFEPGAVADPIRAIHRSADGALFAGTRDFGVYKATSFITLPIEWTLGMNGSWSGAANWAGSNVPNNPNEQARHTVASGPATIATPQGYTATIHSYVAAPGSAQRGLLLRSGTQLTMGSLTSTAPAAGNYTLTQRTGSRLRVTGDVSNGFNVLMDNGSDAKIEGSLRGGTWRVGEAGAINTTSLEVDGLVENAALQLMHGSALGTLSDPTGDLLNCSIRFGESTNSTGGGSLYVDGDIVGGSLLMTPALDFPLIPTRIVATGDVIGGQIDLVSNSIGGPCTAPPEDRPSVSAKRFVDPIGEVRLLKVDMDATNGTVLAGGTWFFDDMYVSGRIDSILGVEATFHHIGERSGYGYPTGPGAKLTHVGRRDPADPNSPVSSLLLEAGWVQLGPGSSEIQSLTIADEGPATCGYDRAELTSDHDGFEVEVGSLNLAFGTVNHEPNAGASLSRIKVRDLFGVDVSTVTGQSALVRIGRLELDRNALVSIPEVSTSGLALDLRPLVSLDNRSAVTDQGWTVRGAVLTFEDDPFHVTPGTPLPDVITVEAHSLDRGAHWFCDLNDGEGVDLKAWGGFHVLNGAFVRLVDAHSFALGEPNDAHGASNSILPDEAVYVDGDIKVESGAVLDLNGLNLYCAGAFNVDGTVLNGSITPLVPIPFGAFDGDGDIDEDDRAILIAAFSGNGVPTIDLRCDGDGDGDVDQDDLVLFEANLTGQGIPASCGKQSTFVKSDAVEDSPMIFPNPANEKINISCTTCNGPYRIIDSRGKVCKDEIYAGSSIDVEALPPGSYLITGWYHGVQWNRRFGIVR